MATKAIQVPCTILGDRADGERGWGVMYRTAKKELTIEGHTCHLCKLENGWWIVCMYGTKLHHEGASTMARAIAQAQDVVARNKAHLDAAVIMAKGKLADAIKFGVVTVATGPRFTVDRSIPQHYDPAHKAYLNRNS